MDSFAKKIRPVNVPKNSMPDEPLADSQVKVLRAVNGSLGWLSSQSGPECPNKSVATGFSQAKDRGLSNGKSSNSKSQTT